MYKSSRRKQDADIILGLLQLTLVVTIITLLGWFAQTQVNFWWNHVDPMIRGNEHNFPLLAAVGLVTLIIMIPKSNMWWPLGFCCLSLIVKVFV